MKCGTQIANLYQKNLKFIVYIHNVHVYHQTGRFTCIK